MRKKLIFSLIPVVALLASSEAILRLLPIDLDRSPMEIQYAGVHTTDTFAGMLTRDHFVADPTTFWAPRPSVPPFNRMGYRGEVLPTKKTPNEFRILAVGDSNTLGHGTSWVNQLPAALTVSGFDADRMVTVINAGVYGFTSYQGKHRLRDFLRYQPDLVLISFAGNESTLNVNSDRDIGAARRAPWISQLIRRSALVRLADSVARKIARSRAAETRSGMETRSVHRVSGTEYGEDLEEMIGMARNANALPLLLTRPFVTDFNHDPDHPLSEYYKMTREVSSRLEVGLIDVDAMAGHSWAVFGDHAHFNDEGHRLMADCIARAILALLKGDGLEAAHITCQTASAFDQFRNTVKKEIRPRLDLDQNLINLKERRLVAEVGSDRFWRLGRNDGEWAVTLLRDGVQQLPAGLPTDRGIKFGGANTQMLLSFDKFDGVGPYLLWIEGETRSNITVKVSWATPQSGGFSSSLSSRTRHWASGSKVIFRSGEVLPEDVSRVRVSIRVKQFTGDVVIDAIRLVQLDPVETAL